MAGIVLHIPCEVARTLHSDFTERPSTKTAKINLILDVSLDYLAGKTDSPLEHRVRKELENSGLTKEQEDAIVELALNSIPIIKKHI